MTDDSTTPSEPDPREEDVADAVVPPPPVFDDDRADAVVPPPPVFEGSTGDEIIPPPPVFDGPALGTPDGAESPRTTRRATDPADFPPPVLPSELGTAPEPDPAFAAPEIPSSGGYRGLTIAIFAFLFVLLGAAIAVGIYLASSVPLNLPSFGSSSSAQDESGSSAASDAPSAATGGESASEGDSNSATEGQGDGEGAVAGQPCSDFCAEVARTVGRSVVGTDGTRWDIAEPWVSSDVAGLSAAESAVGSYDAMPGSVSFSVWRFDDSAAAETGFGVLARTLGEPTSSDSVYGGGRGTQNTYTDGDAMTIIWIVADDDGQPWVMQVQGPNDEAVSQLYLALPF